MLKRAPQHSILKQFWEDGMRNNIEIFPRNILNSGLYKTEENSRKAKRICHMHGEKKLAEVAFANLVVT